jgi:hypothetical protein
MKTIKFFHPEETFTYHIEKCFCKVVFSGKQHQLLVEIHSTDSLDHVDDDSLQNDFSQVTLYIDDFPIAVESVEDLVGQTIEIPTSYEEIEDEDGEIEEILYTSVNFSDGNFEADNNTLSFFQDENGIVCLKWKGEVQDFTEESDDYIPFELSCAFTAESIEVPE